MRPLIVRHRSLSLQMVDCGIRVNAVAPGPIWTPLIVSSYSAEYVKTFGLETPMKRGGGQPFEPAPAYVYLASDDSSFVTGQVLHVNGVMMTVNYAISGKALGPSRFRHARPDLTAG